jgi:allophanate hydrolase subunit 2
VATTLARIARDHGVALAFAKGDRITPARATTSPTAVVARSHRDGPIRVSPGPDRHAFAPDAPAALVSAPYRILPTSDRIGTRLTGPDVPRIAAPERSRPMVCGALEIPRDGQPIVLGPEHPTTGGYPILAVIFDDDLDRFHAIRLGGEVTFEVGQPATSPARS